MDGLCKILFIIMLAISTISAAQKMSIPFQAGIEIDGKSNDWDGVREYRFITDSDSSWRVSGNIGDGDLSGGVKIAWSNDGLYFCIEWKDDIVDTKFIPQDSSIIRSASGRRMDAMYLYDNLKIQLRAEDLNYSCWLAPDGLQWHQLLEKKSRVNRPPPTTKSSLNEEGSTTIELKIDWVHFGISPEITDGFNLLILINDTDVPGYSVSKRMKTPRKFVSFSNEITLN